MRKLVIAVSGMICFCVVLYNFIANNLEYYYFEFENKTEREIALSVEYHFIKDGSFTRKISPFSEIKFRINSNSREAVELKVLDFNHEEKIGYYLSGGSSLFFKTKFRLEYDGKNINTIYDHKIDYWF